MIKNKANYVTTQEAAGILGFHIDYVRRLILRGKIKAEKLGHNWLIQECDLKKVKRQRSPKTKESEDNGSHQR